MTIRHHLTISILALILLTTEMVMASNFEVVYVEEEPRWAFHPNASITYENQAQHHTHGLVVFTEIQGVNGHLPYFIVRTKGVYGSERDRTVQLAERMELAMDMISTGGVLSTAKEHHNYAIFVLEGHRKLRILTVTPIDAKGYARRSNSEYANLTAERLAQYLVDYLIDMYLVFYKLKEPEFLRGTEEGKQIIGMMKWCRTMAKADRVPLTVEKLHDYIDMMPGSRAFKETLESLAYRIPDMYGEDGHSDDPDEHEDDHDENGDHADEHED